MVYKSRCGLPRFRLLYCRSDSIRVVTAITDLRIVAIKWGSAIRAGRSWRVDETYVRVAGHWTYLYRAVDSAGNMLDFLLSPYRDVIGAKGFLQLAIAQAGRMQPRIINVDGHPAYPAAVADLKRSGELGRRCRCRRSPYLNNILEQDHRFVKKRVAASQWFRSIGGALNTIAGYEAMNIIRKGQIRWLPRTDVVGQVRFIERMFGIAA